MSRAQRTVLFIVGAAGLGTVLLLTLFKLPAFGGPSHLSRTLAIAATVLHHTSNAVSSVNFDQRGLDTLGEESILLASVAAVSVLLRPSEKESEREPLGHAHILDATRLLGYVLLPVTVVLGLDVVAHGAITPGGGFQGGVVLGTGLHFSYVAGRYRALQRLRPVQPFKIAEALGAAAFAAIGVAGLIAAGSFLVNFLPLGHFGTLFSSGTVVVLSGAVGIEVAAAVAVLLAHFLEQAIAVEPRGEHQRSEKS